jgi:two-component system chemotaxis response regulator CheY
MKDSPAAKFKVIVTDDVEAFRRLLRIALEESGHFEVIGEAKNGAQAVKLAKELQPDLVLLDLSMPELDGLQALSPIQWECPNAKIVDPVGI